MHAEEEVLAGQAPVHQVGLRAHRRRVRVLHEHRGHRRAAQQGRRVAGEDRAQTRLVQRADGLVDHVEPLDQRAVEGIERGLAVDRAATRVLPGPGDRGQAGHRVHVHRPVPGAAEAVVAADEALLRAPVEARELHDLPRVEAGDGGGPRGRAGGHVGGQLVRAVGVGAQVVPVGEALGEEHVHDRAGQRAVGAGARSEMQVGLRGGVGAVGVYHHERGAAALGRHRVAHHVDLGVDRVAAPDHHQVGVLVDLAQVHPALGSHPRGPAGVGERHADRRVVARVPQGVAQAVDAVALDQAHRPPRPSRCARSGPSPWTPRVAAGGAVDPDGARARRNGPPSRR